ncbi:MAG TPA: methionyl-tRNA formyltransferase, partial [Gammaproteobacteria bacterium]|nr:methionyl-tRNA formyltransferase [Gammaproteobacteria bacterium]
MDPLKIIFAGTPEFAALSLAALLDNNMLPICVLTQPDRPAGRGKKLTASAVKRLAIRHQLSVLQPEKLTSKFIEDQILPLAPDLIIVVAYGLILPRPLLTLPRFGCINVHASLLPRWRGAAPIQRAILAGDTQSGVTIMQMDEGLDTGDVLLSHPLSIRENETGGSLHDRLAKLGANALLEALKKLQAGALTATPQAKE